MGFLKKIGKGISNLWSGVKKIFKKVVGVFGKALNSKWGKALLLVAGIVSMGSALAAGQAAYSAAATAGESFFSSMVAGGSGFLNSLTGGLIGGSNQYVQAASQVASTAGQAAKVADAAQQTENVVNTAGQAGEVMASTAAPQSAITGAAQGASAATGAAITPTQAAANATQQASAIGNLGTVAQRGIEAGGGTAVNLANTLVTTPQQSALAKLGEMAKSVGKGTLDFVKSEGGGAFAGKVVEGYSQGRMLEEQAKEELRARRRLDREWENFRFNRDDFDVNLTPGWRDRASRTSLDLLRKSTIDPSSVQRPDVAGGY